MPRARCRTVSTRVTEEEYALLEAASEKGNVGAWTRSTLLSAATIARPAGHDLVLAEVAALRTIVVNVVYALVAGEPLTVENMQQLIARADQEKVQTAQGRINAVSVRRRL